jgi:hypothetical protein
MRTIRPGTPSTAFSPLDVNQNVETRATVSRRKEAVDAVESAVGWFWSRPLRWVTLSTRKDGAGDRAQTCAVQLGKIDFNELSIDPVLASGRISNEKRACGRRSTCPQSRHPADVHRPIRAALPSSGDINGMGVTRPSYRLEPRNWTTAQKQDIAEYVSLASATNPRLVTAEPPR